MSSWVPIKIEGASAFGDSLAVGDQGAEIEVGNSCTFRTMLEGLAMLAVNTWEGSDPTYFQAHTGATSRIDYICIPTGAYHSGRVRSCKVMLEEGDKLQIIPDSRRADHRPLMVEMELKDELC